MLSAAPRAAAPILEWKIGEIQCRGFLAIADTSTRYKHNLPRLPFARQSRFLSAILSRVRKQKVLRRRKDRSLQQLVLVVNLRLFSFAMRWLVSCMVRRSRI